MMMYQLLLLLVAFAVCAGCGVVAQRKGRNAIAWAIGGFFFGFLALLLVAVLPKAEKATEEEVIDWYTQQERVDESDVMSKV